LALAVVDEQHRFGVRERLALTAKGEAGRCAGTERNAHPAHAGADLLLATWTSRKLHEKAGRTPADRQPVPVPDSRLNEVMDAVGRRALAAGKLVYWICPLVEESETVNLTDAEARL